MSESDLDAADYAVLEILEEIASPDTNPDKSLSAYLADIRIQYGVRSRWAARDVQEWIEEQT